MMSRKPYPSDLTDQQWKLVKPLLPAAKRGGRPRTTDEREVMNAVFAVFYVLKSGCEWRMLPHDFPPYQTIYEFFSAWKKDGTWQKIHDALRSQVRLAAGKRKQPTAGILDSQSVKTTEKGGCVGMMLAKR